jgi:hypothetical protein
MSEPAEWCTEAVKMRSRRAKKRIRCPECGGFIRAGQQYHLLTGKWDGDFAQIHHHLLCWSIYESMCKWLGTNASLQDDELPAFGELIDATANEKHESGGVMPA